MVLVFGAFVLGGERIIKLFGIGLGGAVLLDAAIVRSVLVPARDADARRPQLEAPGTSWIADPAAAQHRGQPSSGSRRATITRASRSQSPPRSCIGGRCSGCSRVTIASSQPRPVRQGGGTSDRRLRPLRDGRRQHDGPMDLDRAATVYKDDRRRVRVARPVRAQRRGAGRRPAPASGCTTWPSRTRRRCTCGPRSSSTTTGDVVRRAAHRALRRRDRGGRVRRGQRVPRPTSS